ncbi:MAG: YihA family ribosome biogenesis GTP-binding protein [Hyphomicrobiales bacterium]|nr:ribosome biogenesis GTP-binding protein YihA/YsxC [Hyphomicrobiales bacterium]MDE2016852.1 YihA family ribosome biogenesis GTP-binding protein [Hyphomicrobiales bacterium]
MDFVEVGRKLFAGPCDFMWAADRADGLPPPGPPEIAFAGRSNVGKSSLVNALTGRKTLARISNTPGRTQQLNFFDLAGKLRLVDMPGYGHAAVGKDKKANWDANLRAYLRGRQPLARVYVLVDSRHGAKPVDREIMDLLDRSAVSYQVVLTKTDAIGQADRKARIEGMAAELAKRPAAHPDILALSAKTGDAVPELRAAVARLLAERGEA